MLLVIRRDGLVAPHSHLLKDVVEIPILAATSRWNMRSSMRRFLIFRRAFVIESVLAGLISNEEGIADIGGKHELDRGRVRPGYVLVATLTMRRSFAPPPMDQISLISVE